MKKVLGFLALSVFMSCGQSENDSEVASTFNYDKFDLVLGCDQLNKTFALNVSGPSFEFQGVSNTSSPKELKRDIFFSIEESRSFGGNPTANFCLNPSSFEGFCNDFMLPLGEFDKNDKQGSFVKEYTSTIGKCKVLKQKVSNKEFFYFVKNN